LRRAGAGGARRQRRWSDSVGILTFDNLHYRKQKPWVTLQARELLLIISGNFPGSAARNPHPHGFGLPGNGVPATAQSFVPKAMSMGSPQADNRIRGARVGQMRNRRIFAAKSCENP
jgi:hypothetical protein